MTRSHVPRRRKRMMTVIPQRRILIWFWKQGKTSSSDSGFQSKIACGKEGSKGTFLRLCGGSEGCKGQRLEGWMAARGLIPWTPAWRKRRGEKRRIRTARVRGSEPRPHAYSLTEEPNSLWWRENSDFFFFHSSSCFLNYKKRGLFIDPSQEQR